MDTKKEKQENENYRNGKIGQRNQKICTKEGAKLDKETTRERKSGPIAKSPLIPTFGTIRLKFLFAKIF